VIIVFVKAEFIKKFAEKMLKSVAEIEKD